jgi:(S)-ureidoglycine aminohydrolase
MPLEGYPYSRIASWAEAQVRVLASPAIGAKFVQYLVDLPAGKRGGFPAQEQVETFFYVMAGTGDFRDGGGAKSTIRTGSFGLTPPGKGVQFSADADLQLLLLQKRYEASPGIEVFKTRLGHESEIPGESWGGSDHARLQTLIPDEFDYDLAMNIFTFDPGFGLPIVETHVMEHGLYFLQGKGLYYLEDAWMEVEKDDFIWMGPYCPQSFYATGPTPSKYIYYKNVNREISVLAYFSPQRRRGRREKKE